jgi:hypothetical protein
VLFNLSASIEEAPIEFFAISAGFFEDGHTYLKGSLSS